MNYALHGIDVVTYGDLLDRGNQSINVGFQTLPITPDLKS